MPKETQSQENRIIYLYRITCLVNHKIYVGQSVDPTSRWRAHRRDAADPKVPIQFAIKKHGAHNFEFEVIASCKNQDDANELETFLVAQYDSYVANGKGYNATHGGFNAPKSEQWLQAMRDWHASLSPEERFKISQKQSISYTKYIEENGHPALGTKRTDEQRANMSIAQKAVENRFSEEALQKMSEVHMGHKDSEETKQKKSESATAAWAERISYDGIRCSVPDCQVMGKHHYIFLENVRYCRTHGQRLRRTGSLELIPHTSHNKGGTSHNRTKFTEEQIAYILTSPNTTEKLSRDFGITSKAIKRVRL
jgi:group I intron endonuclease